MDRLLDTNVRYFDNNVTTAQLKNEWGSIVKVLDEVLVYGSNEQNILSITTVEDVQDSRYWVSTVLLNENHKFEKDIHIVEITNSAENTYNRLFRVQDVGSNFIKIAFDKTKTPNKPTDVTSTGVKIKLAPLGYVKTYSDTNKAIYKTGSGNTCYLRVDDSCPVGYDPTWTKFARVGIYSDINNFDDIQPRPGRLKAPYYPEDPFRNEIPEGSGVSGFYGEAKWYYAVRSNSSNPAETDVVDTSTNAPFQVIGDNRTFYLFNCLFNTTYGGGWQDVGRCFGEYVNLDNPNDPNNHILCSHEWYGAANSSSDYYGNSSLAYYDANPSRWETRNTFSRLNSTWGKYILNNISNNSMDSHVKVAFMAAMQGNLSGRETGISFNQFRQKINFISVYLRAFYRDNTVLLGKMRGYYFIGNNLQDSPNFIPKHKSVLDDFSQNKKFILLTCFQSWGYGNVEYSHYQWSRIAFQLNNWE